MSANNVINFDVIKCGNYKTDLTRTLTEFNTSVIAVTKMITYKFLCGVLLRMHGRFADGVFYLAILVLLKTRQTLIVFH